MSVLAVPHDEEAEMSVLGSMLISPEKTIDGVSNIISSADFYNPVNRDVFSAITELWFLKHGIDSTTVKQRMMEMGIYEDDEVGREYLRILVDRTPTYMNALDYARIVASKSKLRRLLDVGTDIANKAYAQDETDEEILAFAEEKIYAIREKNITKEFEASAEVMGQVYARLDKIRNSPEGRLGIQTGFKELDRYLVGLNPGDLVLVGARPGMGKTAFAMNIALHAAKQTKKTIAVFSLEMSGEQLGTRLASGEALIDSYAMRTGKLNDEEWSKLATAASRISETQLIIDDTAGMSVSKMMAKLRRQRNLGMVVIDYLQLMQSDKPTENRNQEVSAISRGLKLMAKEFNVPVLCCTQLSRATEQRADKKPQLSDLRDSGAIEQDADMVLFLYREEYYDQIHGNNKTPEQPEADATNKGMANVIIAKNRHGENGEITLGWNGKFTKFYDLDDIAMSVPEGA